MPSKPLYRKINKAVTRRTEMFGPKKRAKHDRHTKAGQRKSMGSQNNWKSEMSMYDYAPLFQFLLKKVGCHWDEVWKECQERLNIIDPVLIMVVNVGRNGLIVPFNEYSSPPKNTWEEILCDSDVESVYTPDVETLRATSLPQYWPCFRSGEDRYFSTLYVDENHLLQYVDPNYIPAPQGEYYNGTETFNGKPITYE
ncbi:MAG: hypothetical protein MJZ49_08125 [Bacteroidales bacterium]|nr:hypothetical protein [Bacteroidales bacterium]